MTKVWLAVVAGLAWLAMATGASVAQQPEVPQVELPAPRADGLVWTDKPLEIVPIGSGAQPKKIWGGSFELGFNGNEGNTNLLRLKVVGNVKRTTDDHIYNLDLLYNYAQDEGSDTANRVFGVFRHDWLFVGTPWSCFFRAEGEHDEFKAFDFRLGLHVGSGYMFIKDDVNMLKGSAGIGGSKEFGGQNTFRPELLIGLEGERKLTDRQKIVGSVMFFPDFVDPADYRIQAKLAYELLVDPATNLSLRVGVLDNYDSAPNGRKPNDVEYYLTLLWKF